MALHAQKQFGYQKVQLIKSEPLGSGSYGTVYKATCDDLPCAVKILHSTFILPSFIALSKAPNVVQFLGSFQNTETQLPVLLNGCKFDPVPEAIPRATSLPHPSGYLP